jgi:ribosome-binding factor A
MDYQRASRVGDLLLELVSELLRKEIRDPRVARVVLTAAKVTPDLRQARLYFNLLGGKEAKDAVTAGLKSATGFIRSRLGKQLNLKFVPTIQFIYDETEEEGERIDHLLRGLKD